MSRNFKRCAFLALTWLATGGLGQAQIPEEFTNLQVLPKDVGRRELVSVMRGFSGALGVRCNYCHVGEDPASLEGYDFAGDDKEVKRVARAMMQMVGELNDTLLPKTGRSDLLQVTCVTCHHGLARPQTLHQILTESHAGGGAQAAIAKYRELREESYGRGRFDFGELTLIDFAQELGQQQKIDDAKALLALNLEVHPDSWMTHFTLGEILRQTGDGAAALKSYEEAAKLQPENRQLQQRIQFLRRQLNE